jgi:hypothetical protein
MFKVGTVIQYFEKVEVALIKLDNVVSVGEKIDFFRDGKKLFGQKVEMLQKEHSKIISANRNDIVALKTNEKVEKDTEIFKES